MAGELALAEQLLATAKESLSDVDAALAEALDLAEQRGTAYEAADGQTRRLWNQAFFEKLLVHDDDIAGDERAAPFDDLLDPDLPARLKREKARPPKRSSSGLGSRRTFSREDKTAFEL